MAENCWACGQPETEVLQQLRRVQEMVHRTTPCRVCQWPCPPDNDHYICECCGTHASYEDWTRAEANDPQSGMVRLADGEPDGVERCRARWNGQWWSRGIEQAPLIVQQYRDALQAIAESGALGAAWCVATAEAALGRRSEQPQAVDAVARPDGTSKG